MDFLTKKISEKSELNAFTKNYRDAATQEQSRLEYVLILILGYLWNKNLNRLDAESQINCFNKIARPSIGTIINLSRALDLDQEIFGGKKLKKFRESIDQYPSIRNERIGHGYSFQDDSEKLFKDFSIIYRTMYEDGPSFLVNEIDLVHILTSDEVVSKGIVYKATGECSPCSIPKALENLSENKIYMHADGVYCQISPFIQIENIDDFYIYSYIEDKLASRATFNQLVKTGRKTFSADELICDGFESDDAKLKAANGTIINIFENNYKKYIDTTIVRKIVKFLKENRSTVFATLWGHGGVGKTASIQRVCEVLLSEEKKHFDYVIFASAKDRKFNYYKGVIETLSDGVDSYESAIRYVNGIAFGSNSVDSTEIVNFQGKMLIILDDYETFRKEEKEKILDFIKSLNTLNHKVIITTRSASNITGEEIEVEELTPEESLEFFDSVLENELAIDPALYKQGRSRINLAESIHSLTNGRPLFIFQSAIIYGKSGSISSMLDSNVKTSAAAIDFLYGRIIEYLSSDSRRMFGAMGLLTSDADLSNLLTKLQYILNMEKDEYLFEQSIEELVKLKIITIVDKKYFKVYSSEIVSLMRIAFVDDGSITSRLQVVGRDKSLDNNLSLLDDADNSRLTRKPSEVKQKYRYLISREATPTDIKTQAIINLTQYLIEDNGSYEEGVSLLEEYQHIYGSTPIFAKTFATYLWRGDDDQKSKAINIINNALRVAQFDSPSESLDFLCILMRYEAIFLIEAREQLKDKFRLKEISSDKYHSIFSEQRQEFYRIYNFPGMEIFNCIKADTLKDFDHEMKVRVLNGLSHFIEVCIRRQKFEDVDEILTYVFNHLKYNYHDTLKSKVERINKSRGGGRKHYDDYIVRGSAGDRFEVAKKASLQSSKIGTLGEILNAALKPS